jgi:hypothetical protein
VITAELGKVIQEIPFRVGKFFPWHPVLPATTWKGRPPKRGSSAVSTTCATPTYPGTRSIVHVCECPAG